MLRGSLGGENASRFQVLGPLGSGGFGAVYEAIDQRTQQRVALKQLDNTSGDAIARFKHEFRALADCHHPNLVRLNELIEQDGRWLIVMELVPGSDLTTYVRGDDASALGRGHRFDEGRLRSAFAGVVEGLIALHRYGVLHRDLKPSNIRVRPDGRAVLLDFGLATSTNPQQQTIGFAVGTLRYMAPEQAAGEAVGPATDLYAVGVCLFEALTGQVPFEGESAMTILFAKQQREAPRASTLNPAVPADLDELCARLLASAPGARPQAEDVLIALSGEASRPPSALQAPALPPAEQLFAGRERELEHLARALAATHRGDLRIVLVEGESGVGKSELVAEFLRRAAREHPKLLALRGRCYENEHVSYKAFDGCIDELSKFLRRLPESECAAMMPTKASLLAQLFPVLKNIKAVTKAPRDDLAADLTARRFDAFNAFGALLTNLAEERPLVLVVDDLQWADAESFRMLQALVERPTPPPLLVLATVRPRDELEGEVLAHVNAVRSLKHTDVVGVFGLPREQAKALAAKLLGNHAPDKLLEMIAEESDGHPLFLSELVQYTQSHDLDSRGNLTLDVALRARVDRLDRQSRELLELAALAARPYASYVFAHALDLPSVDEPAGRLLAAKLLRLRKGQELGCYHDRIRHTASELVASGRAKTLHRRLALALSEARDVDPAEQAHHWDLAGDVDRAIATYEVAVARAIETLAFARAAQLCARAMELVDDQGDPRAQRLRVQRATALACGGLSREATVLFKQAADAASGETRIRLRSSMAQQLMLSGKLEEGVQASRVLLRELGFRVPTSVIGLLLSLLWDSTWARLHLTLSRRLKPKAETESAFTRLRLEVLDDVQRVLTIAHPSASMALQLQQLRLAQHAGIAALTATMLSGYGTLVTMTRGLARALPLFEQSRRDLAKHGSPPRLLATQAYYEGAARLAAFDGPGALECLELSERLVREHVPDRPFFVIALRYMKLLARFRMGHYARLASDAERWLAEVRERNDVFGEALLYGMGHGFIRHLMRDDPEEALSELTRIQDAISPEPFSFAHFGLFFAMNFILSYQGGPRNLRWLESFEPRRKSARFMRNGIGRDTYDVQLCTAILHAAVATSGPERSELIRRAHAAVKRVSDRSLAARAFRCLIEAQLAVLEGERELAIDRARRARAQFESLHDHTALNARMLEALLESGPAAEEKREQVLAELREQGWRDPQRALTITLPVLPLLLKRSSSPREARLLLGRYEVTQAIGAGGFGSVVAARDVQTGESLALKELVRTHGKALERFKREFRALQGVHHPNLARLDALLEHEGQWYIAMELVTGCELLEYVRPNGVCDAARLRETFGALALALRALHDAGFVHRDITPRNVKVTAEGRPVLLDFGLIARVGDHSDAGGVGTEAYAAPEQLAGRAADPTSDLYALGVCLYESIFGVRPPMGGRDALATVEVPRELAALFSCCIRLLSPTPRERPALSEVLGALEARPSERSSFAPPESVDKHAHGFSGREVELDALRTAFDETCDEGLSFALVEGESGVGKSALVAEFAERLQKAWPSLLVLAGRCYENEQLPYKAFDGAVDRLASTLRSLPNPQCEALLPKKAALLAQLFPVMTSVPAIAQASKKGLPADPAARKREAWSCFIDLLANLSARRELLFVIDDLQWADGESFALLHALYRERERVPLLFLCTARPAAELDEAVARSLERLRALPSTTSIALEGLSEPAAAELSTALYGGPLPPDRLASLFHETKGHPLFLRELIAQHRRGTSDTGPSLTLNGALRLHLASLPESAQTLLSLVALAGRPHPMHVYARALELSELPRETLSILLSDGLLRRRGASDLACYHDRIRSVVLARLPDERRKELSGKLARALESGRVGEPGDRARLWDQAGERARAIDAYEEAGDRALAGLAFAQAEQSYERALALLEVDPPSNESERTCRLLEQRGHALVRAGRSAQAARCYQLAAERATGDERVRLRIWAAQHLIQSAQVREGLESASALLEELGCPLPKSERSARFQMGMERARLRMRGLKLGEHKRELSSRERLALEALHGLGAPVRAVSYLPGASMMLVYLRRALAAGEPVHTARALAFEAMFRTGRAPHVDQSALFAQSRELAVRAGDPAILAEVELLQGYASIAKNDFAQSVAHLTQAHDLLSTHCPGEPWLLTTARMYLGYSWFCVLDTASIARHAEVWIEEARARDDRYALAALSGFACGSHRHLYRDRPEDALAELDDAMAPWPTDPALFSNLHLGAFGCYYHTHSYRDPREALEWIDSFVPARVRSYLLRTSAARYSTLFMRAEAALRVVPFRSGSERAELLARSEAAVDKLRSSRSPRMALEVLTLSAVATLARGDKERAYEQFKRASAAAAPIGERFGFCPRYFEGALEGGESGAAKQRAVVERLRALGWKNLERALALHVPGIGLVE